MYNKESQFENGSILPSPRTEYSTALPDPKCITNYKCKISCAKNLLGTCHFPAET